MRSVLGVIVCLAWLKFGSAAEAAIVASCDEAGLIRAVEQGEVVSFACDGVIQLGQPLVVRSNLVLDATARKVHLNGRGESRLFIVTNGAQLTLINLTLEQGAHVGIRGTNVPPGQMGGTQGGAGAPGFGGAIYLLDSRLIAQNCTFATNQAQGGTGGTNATMGGTGGAAFGGAIYAIGSALTLKSCVFISNTAGGGAGGDSGPGWYGGFGSPGYGGAIYLEGGAVTLDGGQFEGNRALGGEPGAGRGAGSGGNAFGGAFFLTNGSLAITGGRFRANIARGGTHVDPAPGGAAAGGALYSVMSSASVRGSYFESNLTRGGNGEGSRIQSNVGESGMGGGIYSLADLVIEQCAFAWNVAEGGDVPSTPGAGGHGQGGAVWAGDPLRIINSSFIGNRAQGGWVWVSSGGNAYGGGLYGWYGGGPMRPQISHVTFADNRTFGGAVQTTGRPGEGYGNQLAVHDAVMKATLLSGSATNAQCYGLFTDGGCNLGSDSSCSLTNATSKVLADLRLGPFRSVGGTVPVVTLLPDSPAIDVIPAPCEVALDQRGLTRPWNSACDVGAFEWAPNLTLQRTNAAPSRLLIEARPNQPFELEFSADLTSWSRWATNRVGATGFAELVVTNQSRDAMFFRAEFPSP